MRNRLRPALGVIALTVIGAGIYFAIGAFGGVAKSAAGHNGPAQMHVTLDPTLFTGTVHKAYLAAEQHPGVLTRLHCYCGCERTLGHRNLLDCFRTGHAEHCEICTGEAIMAARMTDQGLTIEQIRDAIRARYAHGS